MLKYFGIALLEFIAIGQVARADFIYNVHLSTSPLIGHPAGPFVFELALTDGNGIGDGNNTVSLSGIDLRGGIALGSPFIFGGASGSLETGITLTDNSFLGIFGEQFVPGANLDFSIDFTGNDDESGIPDRFTLYILDSSGAPLPTLAPFGDYFLGADISSSGPVIDVWGGDRNRVPSVGDPISMNSPSLTATPEPATLWMLAGGLTLTLLISSVACANSKA
jgi:hypothetical protein